METDELLGVLITSTNRLNRTIGQLNGKLTTTIDLTAKLDERVDRIDKLHQRQSGMLTGAKVVWGIIGLILAFLLQASVQLGLHFWG